MLKSFLFGTVPVPSRLGELALFALRLFAGLTMALAHGLGKFPPSEGFVSGVTNLGFPYPSAFAWAATLAELGGGLLLAAGLLTRPAALSMAFTMAVAAFMAHGADPFAKKEMALLYLFISVVYVALGSGSFGLDRFVRGKAAGARVAKKNR